jgi:thiamine biosynthesis lipoprotein
MDKAIRRHGQTVSRRRVMLLAAAAAGFGLPRGVASEPIGAGPSVFRWRTSALGAESRLLLVHPDETKVRHAVEICLAEIARLERIFSLHATDSELIQLNRNGRIARPSLDFRSVLEEARRVSVASDGAFDVTIQPLWRFMADYQARSRAVPPQALDAARRLVSFEAIECGSKTAAFARPGMAATLNGIAQGYITDRIADLLQDMGFDRVLAQLGESMALSAPADDGAWRVAVPDPRVPRRDLWTLSLRHRAVATSAGLALTFEPSGRHHHLLDARTGASPNHYLSVSVLGSRAMRADALSTALFVLPPEAAAPTMMRLGGGEALILHADGRTSHLNVRGSAS